MIRIEPGDPQPAAELAISCDYLDHKGRARLTARLPDGTTHTDTFNVGAAKFRQKFLVDLCSGREGIDEGAVRERLDVIASQIPCRHLDDEEDEINPAPNRDELLKSADAETQRLLEETDPGLVDAAKRLLADPKLVDLILQDIAAMGVVGEELLALISYVIGVSRLLPTPLAGIVQGLTATGKSFVPISVSVLFPPEAVLIATDITRNALYYAKPGFLIHKFVVAGERPRSQDDERAEATRALREMLAAGRLSKYVTVKGADGKLTTELVEQFGPIAFIESTTVVNIFDEDANRCLPLGTDESQEQTRRIVAAQGARAAFPPRDISDVKLLHHTAQRLLKRVVVRVPFAEKIAAAIPTSRQEARRAMPMILSLIQAVAVLYQRQRVMEGALDHGTVIEATVQDYVIARRLLAEPMSRALGTRVPGAVLRFGHRIVERYSGSGEFTSTAACADEQVLQTKSKVNEYLKALAELGVVELVNPSKGGKPAEWRVVGEVPAAGEEWLPTRDQIEGAE
ncbi:MAG: hypothetical protein JNK25_06515 [Phycisphaerae bacterium]|nr:hypothetical protein [Phycisphaerae bacterium]